MHRKKGLMRFRICVRNEGYPASLEIGKIYQVVSDKFAGAHGMVRIIDESGEDYLYPSKYFGRIKVPAATRKVLMRTQAAGK